MTKIDVSLDDGSNLNTPFCPAIFDGISRTCGDYGSAWAYAGIEGGEGGGDTRVYHVSNHCWRLDASLSSMDLHSRRAHE